MPTPPFGDATGRIAIRAGRLLDVATGDLLPDRTLLIRDARIEAVASAGEGTPDDARVIDLGGLTVLPGFIDTHSHLVGEVQSAGVPGTTTSAAQDVQQLRPLRPGGPESRCSWRSTPSAGRRSMARPRSG